MRSRRNLRLATAAATGVVAMLLMFGCSASTATRQSKVAERGAQVMPFDLDATTHTFTDMADGGIQRVTADDPSDARQVALIRQHLRREARRFAVGNFSDPARIHGMKMPGVAELRSHYDQVRVTYAAQSSGARITYSTDDPALVTAIHRWFERQLVDHGDQAQSG